MLPGDRIELRLRRETDGYEPRFDIVHMPGTAEESTIGGTDRYFGRMLKKEVLGQTPLRLSGLTADIPDTAALPALTARELDLGEHGLHLRARVYGLGRMEWGTEMAATELLGRQRAVRGDLCEALRVDLIGPASDDELLEEPPLDRYVTGILYPALADGNGTGPEAQDDVADDDGDRAADPAVAMSNIQYPTSAGVSFAVAPEVEEIRVKIEAARYEELDGGWRAQADRPGGAGGAGRRRRRRAPRCDDWAEALLPGARGGGRGALGDARPAQHA